MTVELAVSRQFTAWLAEQRMPFNILLVSVLRSLVKVAGFALLGQGALAVLAGKYREHNAFYRVLRIVTGPVAVAIRLQRAFRLLQQIE